MRVTEPFSTSVVHSRLMSASKPSPSARPAAGPRKTHHSVVITAVVRANTRAMMIMILYIYIYIHMLYIYIYIYIYLFIDLHIARRNSEKWMSVGRCHWQFEGTSAGKVAILWIMPLNKWNFIWMLGKWQIWTCRWKSIGKGRWKSTLVLEVSISRLQSPAPRWTSWRSAWWRTSRLITGSPAAQTTVETTTTTTTTNDTCYYYYYDIL